MFFDQEKDSANLTAFREQAVDDGYLSTKGMIRTHEGTQCLAAEGTLWEWYPRGAGMTFKQIGSNLAFTVYCDDLPYPDYHN
jgi:hypothetical protein